ncbi:flagellar basal body rod protein FlgB [Rhizobium sp. L1K21]|uniref:flagellar basal body rod protein FlgB n=1 Tax=Rhizobium sp. L1K21 TaxID=2954933 RepID=UPI002091FB85|nr:flagellar basal body rod protein FlgB [Rhizobium sp. L1K21]MCO6187128.1 flagellar basal body rod protein FlgB [Rhizobium sp. L1K21]
MEPIGIIALASKQAEWLTVRQSVVADNIANVNTPNFKTKDVNSFNDVLNSQSSQTSHVSLVTTNARHMNINDNSHDGIAVREQSGLAVSAAGNSVAIAHEMMKSGKIRQEYQLNTGLVKALNNMLMSTIGK